MESNCTALASPELDRFALETNIVSLIMKETFTLIALQVSMFSTVSPFATVHAHVLAMNGLLAGSNLFHKVCRRCGAVGQLREQMGASFSSPSSYMLQSRSPTPVLCLSLVLAWGGLDLQQGVAEDLLAPRLDAALVYKLCRLYRSASTSTLCDLRGRQCTKAFCSPLVNLPCLLLK